MWDCDIFYLWIYKRTNGLSPLLVYSHFTLLYDWSSWRLFLLSTSPRCCCWRALCGRTINKKNSFTLNHSLEMMFIRLPTRIKKEIDVIIALLLRPFYGVESAVLYFWLIQYSAILILTHSVIVLMNHQRKCRRLNYSVRLRVVESTEKCYKIKIFLDCVDLLRLWKSVFIFLDLFVKVNIVMLWVRCIFVWFM